MDKLFKRSLLLIAVVLSITNTKGFDEAYEQDPRRAMLDPQKAILDNVPKQAFERKILPPGAPKERSLNDRLSSDNTSSDLDQPIESLLAVLKEFPSSELSSHSTSPEPSASPLPQPAGNSSPKLVSFPSPKPMRVESSPSLAPIVPSVSPQLKHSSSSLSLASGSASPIIVRVSDDFPLPRSLCFALERYSLSDEFLQDPRYKPFSKAVEKRNKIIVENTLLKWLVDTQAFWARFNNLFGKFEYAARRLREKQEAAYSDASSIQHDSMLEPSLESPLQSPAPAAPGFLSMSFLSEYKKTPEQKRAESLERAQKELAEADAAFREVEREARRRHPTFSFEDLNKKLACGLLAEARPEVLYRPYGKDPSEFKPSEYFLAFLLDPTELRITLFRLTTRIERLESENEALEFLLSIYKRDLVNRVGSWGEISSWKEWYNLNGDEGPLNTIKRTLVEKYLFISHARYPSDHSTIRGIALAALRRDVLGLVLWEACLKHIRRLKVPYNHVQVPPPEAENALNVQYRLLPKHFNSDASSEGFLPIASPVPSFQVIYEGLDNKMPDDEGLQGYTQTSYKIDQRKYINSEGVESIFIPMKDAQTEANKGKTGDEYHSLMTQLRIAKDVVATVSPSDVLTPNPLVEKWKGMPKKFAVMPREFRTYSFMGHHREFWASVLRELHARRNPILIGYGEGLTRLNEPKPTDGPVRHDYDFTQVKENQERTRTLESLLETNRNHWKIANTSPGRLSSLPRAQEFFAYTKPEKPNTARRAISKPFEVFETLNLAGLKITDDELKVKFRTLQGLQGIFCYVSSLNLESNLLVNPMPGIDFRSLRDLNVSNNRLRNLNFLENLWEQLEALNVSNNEITEFPFLNEFDYSNPTLLKLNISSNPLTSLDTIGALTLLKELDVSKCNVGSLTKLTPLVYLESLSANGCGLNGVWEKVIVTAPLERLKVFSLEGNFRLVLLPYMSQKVVSSGDVAKNNRKFNEYFPKLMVLREQRELRATQDRPIILSDLRGIFDPPQA